MLERLGNYQLLESIVSGNLGTVYRAQDTGSDAVVAITIIDPSLSGNSAFLEDLQLQIDLAKLLDHPNITPVQELAIEDGTAYLVMEYISDSLAERLTSENRMSWRQSVSIALQVSRALEHAHENAIFHLNLKPANILIRPDGTPTVAEFGLASPLQNSDLAGLATDNANYRSPEQWDGGQLDGRTDIYSLGIALYQMLEGSLPFNTDDEAAAEEWHRETPMPPFTESLKVPRVVAEVIERAIEKIPSSRYESASAMAEALEDLLSGRAFDSPESIAARTRPLRPISGPPEFVPVTVKPSQDTSKTPPRQYWLIGAGVTAFLVIAIVAGVTIMGFGEEDDGGQVGRPSIPAQNGDETQDTEPGDSLNDLLATIEPDGPQDGTPSASGTLTPTVVPEGTSVPVATPSVASTPSPTATPRPTPTPVFLDEYTQGLLYLSEKDYGGAIFEFDAAISSNPLVSEFYEARALAHSKLGEYLLAVEDYAEAYKLNPTKASLYKERADNLTYLGLDRLAIIDYQLAVELEPGIPGGYRGMGQAWARVDIISVSEDLSPQGMEAFGQALRFDPNDLESIRGRALINLRRGRYNFAIEEFDKLITANPKDVDSIFRRGISRYNITFYTSALTDANTIISLSPLVSEYFYLRSLIYTGIAEAALAQSDLETSCALSSEIPDDLQRLIDDSNLPLRSCPTVPVDLVPTPESAE